ncbi:hypothetical protein [Sphingomonas sp. RS2018]
MRDRRQFVGDGIGRASAQFQQHAVDAALPPQPVGGVRQRHGIGDPSADIRHRGCRAHGIRRAVRDDQEQAVVVIGRVVHGRPRRRRVRHLFRLWK